MKTAITETLSMRKFCELHQLERTKVGRWCKAEGLDTASGVDEELSGKILQHFGAELVEHKEAAIVLHEGMHIDIPTQSTVDQVKAVLAVRRAEKPVLPVPVLNGRADSLLSDALLLNQAVDAFEQKIATQEQQLQERFESVEDAKELIELNIERVEALDERESKLVSVGLELSAIEKHERETLKEQLKKLLKDQPGNI